MINQKLKDFLQKSEVQILLNSNDWEKLFLLCSKEIHEEFELYNVLKETNLLTTSSNNDNSNYYYTLGYYNHRGDLSTLCVDKLIDKNTYNYGYISENSSKYNEDFQVVLKDTFLNLLKICMEDLNGMSIPIRVEDPYDNYVPVKLLNFNNNNKIVGNIEFLLPQKGVDFFDPIKIKDRRILNAAKDEFNQQLLSILKKGIGDINSLKDKLSPYYQETKNNDDYGIVIQFKSNRCIIQFNYNANDKDQILKTIKQNIRGPLTVMPHPTLSKNAFMITVNLSMSKKIKSEVEDMFDISF